MEQASRILARSNGLSKILDQEQVACRAWAGVVGKKVARSSRAVNLVRGLLTVEVDDDGWKKDLTFLKKDIIGQLAGALGEDVVQDIYFKVIPPRFAPQRQTGRTLFDDAEAITDPGLRRIYRQSKRRLA
jgi:predicted nucleic acid-binding Zn ribbon protein